MRRGDVFLARKPGQADPSKQRAFVVVSRQILVDSKFSTVVCAPVYSRHDGLSTRGGVGLSLLDREKLDDLDRRLAVALDLEE